MRCLHGSGCETAGSSGETLGVRWSGRRGDEAWMSLGEQSPSRACPKAEDTVCDLDLDRG